MNKDYLSKEEQYKEFLNQEEINRIEDYKLRSIRMKYWNLRHKAFLDEQNLSDKDFNYIYKNLINQEKEEIEKYKLSLSK